MARLHSFRAFTRRDIYTAGWAFLYVTATMSYIMRNHYLTHRVRGPSMTPTLSPHYNETGEVDTVLMRRRIRLADDPVEEGGSGAKSQLERGMLVMFRTPHDPERVAVKRVLALDGDEVLPLRREGSKTPTSVIVPFGHVWVEGDNPQMSRDSNDYGPISKSLIEGVATTVLFPKARRGAIGADQSWKARTRGRVKEGRGFDEVPIDWAF